MAPRARIPNDDAFRAMWDGGVSADLIAAHYDVAHATSVYEAAKRYGFPKRERAQPAKRRLVVPSAEDAARAEQAAAQHAEAARATALVGRLVDRGIAARDASALAVGLVRAESYADLSALARPEDGLPLQRLLPLWREVRA